MQSCSFASLSFPFVSVLNEVWLDNSSSIKQPSELLAPLQGKCSNHQMELITNLLGTPSEAECANIKQKKSRAFIESMPFKPKQHFGTVFKVRYVRLLKYFPHTAPS